MRMERPADSVIRFGFDPVAPLAAQLFQNRVHCTLVQPGPEGTAPVEIRQLPSCLDKRLLHCILHHRLVVRCPKEHLLGMDLHQLTKGVTITATGHTQQNFGLLFFGVHYGFDAGC
jgi:hypothetical protein